MIEAIIEWSVRNRLIVILAACALALAGVQALRTVPVDAIPDLSENQVIVFTDWPGRSPQEIEDQITYPLSVNLQGLAGVKVVRSSSEFNFSMITIIFGEDVDFYFARQRVLERLSIAETFLPEGVTPYLAPDATALGQIFWYTVEGAGQDLGELRAIQDWYVRYQLNSVPGVAEVASVGGAPREYQVDLDPDKLRAYGVTLGEVYEAVTRANSAVGGRVIHKGNAEYLIRSVGWIRDLDDLRKTVVAQRNGVPVALGTIAAVQMGPGYKRSVLEKDGREVVGGVVLMRHNENPREVTRRVKEKISSLRAGLPEGVRIVPFYDRTPLIDAAVENVEHIVIEEMFICTLAILLILGHFGASLIISITLPMAILISFLLMKWFGVSSNIMSLAGIAISVGILIDQAVVMTENAAHHLTKRFGDQPIRGDIRDTVIHACRTVGRPIFFSVLITILSFLPVFALSGIEGKMFHPLAYTKTFALVGVGLLSITLVPALIPTFLKGRIKSEQDSWLVRSMINIFRPMLDWLLDKPFLVIWLFVVILGMGGLAASQLGREFMPKLNEGTMLEMPTSVPRMSVTQVAEDLKVRDAVIRSFPEVTLVVGKAGRAETATDPSPLDMIETIINLRPREHWPKRILKAEDANRQAAAALAALERRGLIQGGTLLSQAERAELAHEAGFEVAALVNPLLRDLAMERITAALAEIDAALPAAALEEILAEAGPEALKNKKPLSAAERTEIAAQAAPAFRGRFEREVEPEDATDLIQALSGELARRGLLSPSALADSKPAWRQTLEEAGAAVGLVASSPAEKIAGRLAVHHDETMRERIRVVNAELLARAAAETTRLAAEEALRLLKAKEKLASEPSQTLLSELRDEIGPAFAGSLLLWPTTQSALEEELNAALQLPGWGNIFTQPIINRIDMLSTGVRTQIGIKVFGDNLDAIQKTSQEIADVVKTIRGAADVVPDQIVGKGYVEIEIDHDKAARYGIRVGDIQDVVEVAIGGKPLTVTVEGRRRYPVRVRYARAFRVDEEALKRLMVAARGSMASEENDENAASAGVAARPDAPTQIPLAEVATVKVTEGPSVIKSENGLLRAYVQLNVRGRDAVGFVEEARRVVAEKVKLPHGMYLEWAGEFEHQARARKTLQLVFPLVLAVIAFILYITYRSFAEVLLVMTSVLGALAGGAMLQWILGVNFSVAVQVGYIACFGMAVETGVVMLVYLREAIEERGGLARINSVAELREAVLEGAVHRLRPKLLTEGVAIIALAPMAFAGGVGSEMIRPMAAPVLGGLLIADEVIDVFLPVIYFHLMKRRWRKLRGLDFFDEDDVPAALAPRSEPAPSSIA